jgi:hypothetical protein
MKDNYFQEVLLPLHIKLQGLYREKCGNWQVGDDYFCASCYYKGTYHPLDHQNCPEDLSCKNVTRLPRTIDDSSTEAQRRSLWRMVDWERQATRAIVLHWLINPQNMKLEVPTESILKALIAQEGIKP